jgi:hypothetical protein
MRAPLTAAEIADRRRDAVARARYAPPPPIVTEPARRHGPPPRISDDVLRDLHVVGRTDRDIARRTGMSQPVVSQRLRRMGLAPHGPRHSLGKLRSVAPRGKTAVLVAAMLGGATPSEAGRIAGSSRWLASQARRTWINTGRVTAPQERAA